MKKVLRSIGDFFSRVFQGVLVQARKYAKPAVLVVELLKKAVESDAAGFLVRSTATQVDDIILARAKLLLPQIFNMLQITRDCSAGENGDEVIQCALQKIKLMHPDAQRSTWLNVAGHLSAAFSDGRFSFGEIVGLAWYIYHSEVKKD